MTAGALSPATVAATLVRDWGVAVETLDLHRGGMNSQTWFVRADGQRFVAKAVPADRRVAFEAGLTTAALVEASGIHAGAPMPARDGSMGVVVDDHALALLRFVEGSGMTGESVRERRLIGTTLGRVHLALAGREVPGATRFHWLDPSARHLAARPWVRPAIEAAVAAWDAIPPDSLTWGLLHTDPAPEAFLLDSKTGECGLIDWDGGVVGPLLYDLASAEMYVGGAGRSSLVIDAYLATGAVRADEVERALRLLARLRWAVHADYFARRILTDDLTGIADKADNERGLEDARRGLFG